MIEELPRGGGRMGAKPWDWIVFSNREKLTRREREKILIQKVELKD